MTRTSRFDSKITIPSTKNATIKPDNGLDTIVLNNLEQTTNSTTTVTISDGTDTIELGSLTTSGSYSGIGTRELSSDWYMQINNGTGEAKLMASGFYVYNDEYKIDDDLVEYSS